MEGVPGLTKLNINTTLSDNLHNIVDKYDIQVKNGKYQHRVVFWKLQPDVYSPVYKRTSCVTQSNKSRE